MVWQSLTAERAENHVLRADARSPSMLPRRSRTQRRVSFSSPISESSHPWGRPRPIGCLAEVSGFLVGPPVFKTGVTAKAVRRVRFPSTSADLGFCLSSTHSQPRIGTHRERLCTAYRPKNMGQTDQSGKRLMRLLFAVELAAFTASCATPQGPVRPAIEKTLGPAPTACPVGAPERSPWPGSGHGDFLVIGPVFMNRFYADWRSMTLSVGGPRTPDGWRVNVSAALDAGYEATVDARTDDGVAALGFERSGSTATQELHLQGRGDSPPFNGNKQYNITFIVPRADCYNMHVAWTGPDSGEKTVQIAAGR